MTLSQHLEAVEKAASGSYQKVDGMILDATTARLVKTVYDHLGEENRAKFGAMEIIQAVNVSWKLVERDVIKFA